MFKVDKILKEYKFKKAYIDTAEERIKAYQEAIDNPDIRFCEYYIGNNVLGMPRTTGSTSGVEHCVVSEEEMRKVLKRWINDEESRIFLLKVEVTQIDKARKGLTERENFLISFKYEEKMHWKDIELSFRANYKNAEDIELTQDRLKQICGEAMGKLRRILEPYYNKRIA